jgi:hypothetical protein
MLITGLALAGSLAAQDEEGVLTREKEEKPPYNLMDHLALGGNMGLMFGNVTYVGLSPLIGYRVTERFMPGIGISYSYIRMRYQGYPTETAHIYGGSVWARYFILDNIFAHAEYEGLNGEWDPYYRPGKRYVLNSLLVGGGYRESFGGFGTYALVLYNINDSSESPYESPLVLRVGFGYGF